MWYIIRYGTDGIGLSHVRAVYAGGINEARTLAASALREDGYGLLAEKGLFTVHGVHPSEVFGETCPNES